MKNIKKRIERIHNNLKTSVMPFTLDESDKVTRSSYPEDFTEYYPNPDAPHAHNSIIAAIHELRSICDSLED